MNLTDPDTLTKLGKLILTDLVLAGDNALVIAMATRSLGPKQQFWGRAIGAGGAVGLRVIFVAIIAWLMSIPFLQLAGGLILIWISWKLVRPQHEALEFTAGEPEKIGADGVPIPGTGTPNVHVQKEPTSLKQAILMIVMADITMSFDNVVAISNIAGDSMSLVIFGLLLSIPLVVWGSVLVAKLMEKYRWIIWLGGGVLGHVAGDIIFKDKHVLGWFGLTGPAGVAYPTHDQMMAGASPLVHFVVHGIPWILAVGLFIAGWLFSRRAITGHKAEVSGA